MTLLLKDGVRYNLWIPDREETFEEIIKEHARDIFGEDTELFDIKKKIKTKAGIGSIPDGYVITFADEPRWYIVEIELSSHPIYEHVVPQLVKFISGVENPESRREITNALYNEIKDDVNLKNRVRERIGSGEIHQFISNLLSKPPKLVIIIDEVSSELEETCKILSRSVETDVVEFKTFEREEIGLGVHVHLFEPLFTPIMKTPIKEKRVSEISITIGGHRVKLTKEDILNVVNDPKITDFAYKTTYAEIEGKRYSVKGLISLATGIPTSKFITRQAEGILRRLDIKVFKVK